MRYICNVEYEVGLEQATSVCGLAALRPHTLVAWLV
jgi:hypothetical protein